jgi:hypothetical protein
MVTLTQEEFQVLGPEERKAHLAAEEKIVFGQNFERDRNGRPVEAGIGSPAQQSINSLAAIRKWEGEEAYQAAVAKVWKENPEHAQRLNLPKRRAS